MGVALAPPVQILGYSPLFAGLIHCPPPLLLCIDHIAYKCFLNPVQSCL